MVIVAKGRSSWIWCQSDLGSSLNSATLCNRGQPNFPEPVFSPLAWGWQQFKPPLVQLASSRQSVKDSYYYHYWLGADEKAISQQTFCSLCSSGLMFSGLGNLCRIPVLLCFFFKTTAVRPLWSSALRLFPNVAIQQFIPVGNNIPQNLAIILSLLLWGTLWWPNATVTVHQLSLNPPEVIEPQHPWRAWELPPLDGQGVWVQRPGLPRAS